MSKRSQGVEFFCATCAAPVGQRHRDYCYRTGRMMTPGWFQAVESTPTSRPVSGPMPTYLLLAAGWFIWGANFALDLGRGATAFLSVLVVVLFGTALVREVRRNRRGADR